MTVTDNDAIAVCVFFIALIITVTIVFRLHLFEPVLKHHYNHRNKDNIKYRHTKYGMYNVRKKEDTSKKDK